MGQIKEIQKLNTEVIIDVICDCCGMSCKVDDVKVDNTSRVDHDEIIRSFEYMKMSTSWGYRSNKDLENWEAYICEKCIDEKFKFVDFTKSKTRFRTYLE